MPTEVGGLPVGRSATVTGADITVSYLLNNPRVIERRVGEATNFRYFADAILPNVGAPGGGVVIYQEWDPRYALMTRKAEELAADAEVPLAGHFEGDLKTARASADGLGYTVSDPERIRNQRFIIDRKELALAHSIADKFNAKAVAVVLAAISAASRTFVATDWSALVTMGANPDPVAQWPHSTLALINAQQQTLRIPWIYDGLLAHPLDLWRLGTIYLPNMAGVANQTLQLNQLQALTVALGLSQIISDNTGDVPHGSPVLYSRGNVGGTAWEEPIQTEIVPERRRRRDVVQCVGSSAYFVDNPYGLLQLTGTATADLTP
jgi:hypothetical protein